MDFRCSCKTARALKEAVKHGFVWVICVGTASADAQLNKLTQCADIQRLYDTLKTSSATFGGCRTARGPIELALAHQLPPGHAGDICFWDSTPANLVSGFSCLTFKSAPRGLLCVRQTPAAGITEYLDHYQDHYAAISKAYTHTAASCAVSNGDASESRATLLPPPLMPFAKFSFGFVSQLGKTIPTDSLIHHGFATVANGELRGRVDAIEFVDIYFANSIPNLEAEDSRWQTVGHWRVNIDDGADMQELFAQEFRRNHVSAFLDFTSADVKTTLSGDFGAEVKRARLSTWQDALVQSLRTHGFSEVTEDEMKGQSFGDLLKQKLRAGGIGNRHWTADRISDRGFFLVSRHTPHCARTGGSMVAMVMAIKPKEGFRTDFGSVALGIMGADSCGRRHGSPEDFVDAVIRDAKSAVISQLESGN